MHEQGESKMLIQDYINELMPKKPLEMARGLNIPRGEGVLSLEHTHSTRLSSPIG